MVIYRLDRTPPRVPVPDAITATVLVEWTQDNRLDKRDLGERSKCLRRLPIPPTVKCVVVRFLNTKNVKPAEIQRQLVEIYDEDVMTDGMVRKWVRQFNDGRTNVHDEARSGQPSVVNDSLVAKVNEKIRENSRFTIRMLCEEFPQISKTVFHEIVTNRLNYRKLCSRWVPKMLTDVHKTKGLGSALTFLSRYSEEGNEFLNKILTSDETWVCHVTPESK
ncbi:hypothetical protein AVEN_254918-1 [Araneus ventricosus]|uniref:Mos1 transposase HTH domain-containing protein n=1 Tax=Araneus ventricosus TaxID=182803 RepID=A0A4Y2VMT2_ARAVE|nr:hypothetical protein AVEN_254918-1 [Araneus ventricosus]